MFLGEAPLSVGAMKAKFTPIQRVPIFPMKLLWWIKHHAAWCDVQTPAAGLPLVVLARNSMNWGQGCFPGTTSDFSMFALSSQSERMWSSLEQIRESEIVEYDNVAELLVGQHRVSS